PAPTGTTPDATAPSAIPLRSADRRVIFVIDSRPFRFRRESKPWLLACVAGGARAWLTHRATAIEDDLPFAGRFTAPDRRVRADAFARWIEHGSRAQRELAAVLHFHDLGRPGEWRGRAVEESAPARDH